MIPMRDLSLAPSFCIEWLPTLAQSQGFLVDALDANRSGRYSEAQVQLLELRGRRLLKRKSGPALVALGISLIGFLFTLFVASLPRPQIPGVVTGPDRSVLFTAPLISVALLVIASFVLRSCWRAWRSLRADLAQPHIAYIDGEMTLAGPSLLEYAFASETATKVPMWERYAYIVRDVSFQVDPRAWFAFKEGPWTKSRFRVYYVPSCRWIVNMEPVA